MKSTLVSPISIDLGGRYTGICLTTYEYGELPTKTYGCSITIPEDGSKMTWSQQNRTAVRHRVRSNKRRKLAKRLLQVIINQLCDENGIGLSKKEFFAVESALNGLLNRRGYNRIEAETDTACLNNVDPSALSELLPEFNSFDNVNDQWGLLSQNMQTVRDLLEAPILLKSVNEIKRELSGFEREEKENLVEALKTIRDSASDLVNQRDFGHQHRKEYLVKIRKEIQRDSRLKKLRDALGAERVYSLIGNISNLQLRATRWYFNDSDMKNGDVFDSAKLKEVMERWVRYWRPELPEERERQRAALDVIQHSSSAIEILCSLNPNLTIPPYEDQDNRRPPKDRTLLLSPTALNTIYRDRWQRWAQILRKNNSEWADGIEDIIKLIDRRTRLPKNKGGHRIESSITREELWASYFMQRLLDRTSKLDPYALRLICKRNDTHKAQQYMQKLAQDLGQHHVEEFLTFCRDYYSEVERARQGLWLKSELSLLERSDINPPHKRKLMHQIVGGILGQSFTPQELQSFIESIWVSRVFGNSTVRGVCKRIESLRKDHGNLFNEKLRKLRYRIENLGQPQSQVLTTNDSKAIWKTYTEAKRVAVFIADNLSHSELQRKRYDNLFSLAQLYTVLESDPRGFSSVGVAVNLELSWRMSQVEVDGQLTSRCARMPADSVRPFDGVLKRILEAQAYAIANKKVAELKALNIPHGSTLNIPILVEENRFAFTEGLLEVKNAGRSKIKDFQNRLTSQAETWQEKTQRIKSSSQNICPYTGQAIGNYGEYDHIIPRAQSRANKGTVFNSEANLIWCTRKGNQDKGDQEFFLKDLAPSYLQALFTTGDVNQIRQTITTCINSLPIEFTFDALTEEQRKCVRHALFLEIDDIARQKVEQRLHSHTTSRVNGTQAWLARRLLEHIQNLLGDWVCENQIELRFHAGRINPQEVSRIRTQLGERYPETQKTEHQGIASHAIDALCVLAQAATDTKLADVLALSSTLSEDIELLRNLIPEQIVVHPITRRPRFRKDDIASQPLFKEGIYAEHFLPIWQHDGVLKIGFDPYQECIRVEGNAPETLLALLAPVLLNKDGEQIVTDIIKFEIAKNKAFALLDMVWREETDEQTVKVARVLNALRFCTSKKNLENVLLDANKTKFKKHDEIIKSKDFLITVKLSEGSLIKASGKCTLPAKADWEVLLKHQNIAPFLGSKTEAMPNLRQLFETHFNAGSSRDHSKTRRVFSLPKIDSPSGGFRVKRQAKNGENMWQLHAIEGFAASGFAVRNNVIQWKETVMPTQLRQSQNITPVSEKFKSDPDSTLLFDEWLTIHDDCLNSTLSVAMAPGTKDRMYIRVSLTPAVFLRWTGLADMEIFAIPSEIKVEDVSQYQASHATPLLGKPRSKLFIESVNKSAISYWYIVESTNSDMRKAYQKAYNKKHNLQ